MGAPCRDAERPRKFCLEFVRVKLTRFRLIDRALDREAARSAIGLFRRNLGRPRTPSCSVKFNVELVLVKRRTRFTFFIRSALMLLLCEEEKIEDQIENSLDSIVFKPQNT